MLIEFFDLKNYQIAQILDAVMCPLNRSETMKEHRIDEWSLYRSGTKLLLKHYIENGGAVAFARRRAEFIRKIEVPDYAGFEYCI